MNAFDKHGHLTEEALRVLTDGGSLTELERLELAEHLSYCDGCLERYAALLAETPLMEPPTLSMPEIEVLTLSASAVKVVPGPVKSTLRLEA